MVGMKEGIGSEDMERVEREFHGKLKQNGREIV